MQNRLVTVVVLAAAFAGPAAFFARFPAVSAQAPATPQVLGRGQIERPPRDVRQPEREVGTAVVRGRVQTADTGAPIRRAQIRAVSAGGRDTRLVTTDAEGRFELRDLPAGRWELTAAKGGYVSLRYGQRRPFEAGRPLELADGQVVQQVNFALPRGAVIAGRVLDEFGDPVAGARVQALRYQLSQGTRRLTQTGMVAQTDDTGGFRLYGLMPGDYYVSALLRALPADDSADATGYAPTYYPGTGSVTEAQPVALGVSEEATISFALQAVRTARVAGSAVTSTGVPLSNGMVMLLAPDGAGGGPLAFGAGNRIRQDGTFTLSNVAPGAYTLMASSGGPGLRGGGGEIELGTLPITVAGDDVTGVTVVTGRGATVTGVVVAAPGSSAVLSKTTLQVTAPATGGGLGGFPGLGGGGQGPFGGRTVAEDGTFTLANLFGSRLIRLNGLPQEWMLEAVMVDGRDVTDQPVEFAPNADITGARIVVTDRVTEVSGSVTAADGKSPSRDFTVVVFPDEEARWAAPSRYVRTARPDQQGLFKIRALPPHDRYLAVALDYLEQGEDTDGELLASLKGQATAFRMRGGDAPTLSLKLVTR